MINLILTQNLEQPWNIITFIIEKTPHASQYPSFFT